MLKRLPFGEFLPDRPLTVSGVSNVWAMADGYRPVKQFSAMTPALSGFLGGAAYVSSSGAAALLAGTATDLYRYTGAAWSSVLAALSASIWRFDQFGDNVIAVNGGAPISYGLVSGAAAAISEAPTSDLVATVREQVFLAGDPDARNTLAISGYNDSEGWAAGVNQCLYVPFPSGGDITGLAGGETGIILQKRAVRRATYVGPLVVWQFDEISHDIGCMASGSVGQAGTMVFFLSEQGFKVCDRNAVVPIASEKLDRTFFNTYSRADIDKISCAVDPRTTTVMWAMPGSPGRIWAYNWTLERWAIINVALSSVFSGFTSNIGLDAVGALYPSGLDSIPLSLDAAKFAGGNPLFLLADPTGIVGTLSGANLAASLTLQPVEVAPGYRVRLQGARAVTDAVAGTVTIDARARAGDPAARVISGALRDNGRCPLRANGRHIGITLDIPAGADWTYALGMDLQFEREGER